MISLAVIIAVLILFSSKGIEVLNRSSISSTASTSIEVEPTPIKVVASPQGGFMFSVGIFEMNLSNPMVTFFNISLTQDYYSPVFNIINQTNIPLVQCTPAHYNFSSDVVSMFYKLQLSNALCPPLGYTF